MQDTNPLPARITPSLTSAPALAVTAALLLAAPHAVLADDAPDFLEDPFYAALGTYVVNSDTVLRLDGNSGRGTPVNWENTFGGGELSRFRLEGQWRFAERHKARIMWFNFSRTKSRTLEEEIEWGDEIYPVNARVTSEFEFDVYELAYEYAFLRRDNFELAGSAGLHWTTMAAALKAKASTSNGTLETDLSREGSVDLPLPVLGLRGTWGLPHNFWIDAGAQFFSMSIDEYDGSLQDYRVMLTWQPKEWVGLSLGYNVFRVDVDVDSGNFEGNIDWQYDGPMLSYSVMF